jgi:DNA polymerase V
MLYVYHPDMTQNTSPTRGGKRSGAGRKAGSGRYGEKTVPVRLPLSLVGPVQDFVEAQGYKLPLYGSSVRAGVPTMADDHVEEHLSVNELLVKKPSATFFVRVQGDSMLNAGIHDGDLLVVDRSLPATHGKVVIAVVDTDLTVKRLDTKGPQMILRAENPAFDDIIVGEEAEFGIWGVVTNVIHPV